MPYRSPNSQDIGDLYTGTRMCLGPCGQRHPMTDFYWAVKNVYRVRRCKECTMEATRERKRNRDKEEREEIKSIENENHIRRMYGLTKAGLQELWDFEGGRCAICGTKLNTSTHADKIQIDHNHETGTIRGLLCFKHNTALGKFEDSIEMLLAAIAYLQREPPVLSMRSKKLTPGEITASHQKGQSRRSAKSYKIQGEHMRGELGSMTILTESEVREIRKRHAAGGVTQSQLAREHRVNPATISAIIRRKTWAYLE